MAFVLEDRVVETANNPGQGDFELLGATDNNRSFVTGIGDGNTTRYLAIGAEGWEIGVAQVSAGSPDRLLRPGTVTKNSDGSTTPINFTGTVTVACVASIEDVLWLNEDGDLPARGGRDLGTDGDRWRNGYFSGMLMISGRQLIENGENSNGHYVRFSDGTQICWHEIPNLGPIETTTGQIYRSTSYSWDYPAAFTSVQSVVGQGVRNNVSAPPVWLGFSQVGGSNSSFWLVASTNNSSTAFLAELVAFGRWY